ncbi:nucleolar protein 14-like [Selaginella moellendorffii]|uniref:nucleolar protein 14-like n=1 Tax=Selaginella moellendorffii TaxID=88036 RepID=UPI000D1CF4E4|nr:nucleolar protein 14-like [Selaginella moellendorffii]|eukprot:XP_024521488.1 nucleolar protein 14-like [Selaginella moellendorffii]
MAKKKRPAKAAPRPAAAAPSLFETLWSRRKFDILGKKQKGEGRRIGELRSRGIEKRKKTILREYKLRHKSNAFVDRRFGENDEEMSEDEKAIMRFQRERLAQLQRKSKFALPDAEEEEEEEGDLLTHKGAALSTLDDFNEDVSLDDEEELPQVAGAQKELNFGGGFTDADPARKEKRSKKEIMEEVIAKSKHFKAVKAKEKEDDLDLREKLDSDFKVLAETPALLSLMRPKKINTLKALLAKGSIKNDKASDADTEKEKPDDYDKLMKEMAFEIRAQASERLKTSEEIAKEEKERLEELEKKRIQRMTGAQESDSEADEDDGGSKRKKKRKRAEISGDDLGENFVLEEEYQEKGWVDEVMARTEAENPDASDTDNEENGDDDDEEETNFDEAVQGEDSGTSGSEESTREELIEEAKSTLRKEDESDDKDIEESRELPFVINAPQTLEQLLGLVKHRSTEELGVAIQRIRACNAISLAAENRKKMQVFYNVLVLYISDLAGVKPLPLDRINMLTKPLIEMSLETPYYAAACARERLIRMQQVLSDKLRSKDGDESSCWPSVRTLLLMRLWSLIFPGSDFRHVVMTPLVLLLGEYLMRCPVTSGRDVGVGAFLCSLALSIMKHARRFFPEALSFLLVLLSTGLPDSTAARKTGPQFLRELVGSRPWLLLKDDNSDKSFCDPDFPELMAADADLDIFDTDSFRCGILNASIQTLKGFVTIYNDLPSTPEILKQFVPVLLELSSSKLLPKSLKATIIDTLELIHKTVEELEKFRQPLQLRLKKPTPIKQFNPKFEEDFAKGRDYDIDRDRAERKKLRRQIQREAKGAARELRKDNQFLAAEKLKERAEAEQEREDKYKKAMAFLEEQEAAAKSGQLGRKKKRRR